MKRFLKDYGFAIISVIVIITLVAMSSPIGTTIKTEVSNITSSFAALAENKFDHIDYDPDANPYTEKVLSVQALYDVGEQNLTQDDIVSVNGIDCYVLKVEGNKAELITKDIYDVRFDTGGHTAEETTHLGTASGYTDKTYDYYYSTLRIWMNEFYRTQLGADSRILPTTVTYYTSDVSTSDLNSYATGTIADQYVFALDAKEAKQYRSKFKWTMNLNYNYGFWTTAGVRNSNGHPCAWNVRYYGGFDNHYVDKGDYGARPALWLSLE